MKWLPLATFYMFFPFFPLTPQVDLIKRAHFTHIFLHLVSKALKVSTYWPTFSSFIFLGLSCSDIWTSKVNFFLILYGDDTSIPYWGNFLVLSSSIVMLLDNSSISAIPSSFLVTNWTINISTSSRESIGKIARERSRPSFWWKKGSRQTTWIPYLIYLKESLDSFLSLW